MRITDFPRSVFIHRRLFLFLMQISAFRIKRKMF